MACPLTLVGWLCLVQTLEGVAVLVVWLALQVVMAGMQSCWCGVL